MATGKSTVADLLAIRLPRSVHIHGDVFRRMVVSGRADMTPNPSPDAMAQLNLRYSWRRWLLTAVPRTASTPSCKT